MTFLYQIDEAWEKENRLTEALQYAYKNKTHPTIADVLERLQVVVELVKNDVTVR
jgi:uncharacterized protein YciW